MLRATTAHAHPDVPRNLDLEDAARVLAWLNTTWLHDALREALLVANPQLHQRIEALTRERCPAARQLRRAVLSLTSYLLRWDGRTTPFGLFAGVAGIQVGAEAQYSWGGRHRVHVRPDAVWLADVLQRLEEQPEVRERLSFVTNNTGHRRGTRFVVPGIPDAWSGEFAPVEVSVEVTRPVALVLDAAQRPCTYGELHDSLLTRFPSAKGNDIARVLDGLIAQGVLLSSLRAPMTDLDPLGHLCEQLHAVQADEIPHLQNLLHRLRALHHQLAVAQCGSAAPLAAALTDLRQVSNAAPVPLVVDTSLDADVQLPRSVVREAAQAVEVMYRLTPAPFGRPEWRDYHQRFRSRYGVGACVPLMELVSDSGLGLPAGFQGSARQRQPRVVTPRDEKLLALVQDAQRDGHNELVLDEGTVASLALGADEELLPVPRVEVAFEVHAESLQSLNHGAFEVAITGAPRPATSMAGRFLHLLSERERAEWASSYISAEVDTQAVQLSFVPRKRRNENVARTPEILDQVITLAEHRRHESGIPLQDLAVTADARRFHLVQRSTGRHLAPRVLHALEASVHTPPLARFLAELPTARCAAYGGFDLGLAAALPSLPRVCYRNTILSPARWRLRREEISASDDQALWDKHLDDWRGPRHVPKRVLAVVDNQRLPLDLEHPWHRRLLRRALNATGHLELREAPAPGAFGWCDNRPHELLLPLIAETPAEQAPLPTSRGHAQAQWPGRSRVLTARLNAHPARFDDILLDHLPTLLDEFISPPRWWFIRAHNRSQPGQAPQLVLHFHLSDPSDYASAGEASHDWATRLRDRHLCSDLAMTSYTPQVGRYGSGPAMDAAHRVFHADSLAALAQLQATRRSRLPAPALTAASMLDLATAFAASPGEALHWLVDTLPRSNGPLDPHLRDEAFALLDGPALPRREELATTWHDRAQALVHYRARLLAERDPLTVLRSLLHQHQLRALSVDEHDQETTDRLVRSCALRRINSPRRNR